MMHQHVLPARRATAAGALALALSSCGGTAGQALAWPSAISQPAPPSATVITPVATPAIAGVPADPASLPAAFWQNLNENTAGTAMGEYVVIQELEAALEAQLHTLIAAEVH